MNTSFLKDGGQHTLVRGVCTDSLATTRDRDVKQSSEEGTRVESKFPSRERKRSEFGSRFKSQ
jgi:hypothetical protein